jgi:hypothetical protein
MTLLPSTIQRTGGWWRTGRYGAPVRTGSWLLALAAAACTFLAFSCGGSDDDGGERYVESVNEAQKAFAARVDELSEGITATSSAARDRRTLRSFEEAVDEVGGDLRAIRPPGEVRALHERLITAVDGYGEEVQQAAHTLETSKSASRLRGAQQELAQATTSFGTTLNETIDEINKELAG